MSMRGAGIQAGRARRWFITLWVAGCVLKLAIAMRLPLFVDEAFYWQEGQHLAWAYSDLPGLTAWLAHLGNALAPGSVLALRLPFLLIGACVPWLVVRMTARLSGARIGWQAGTLVLLLPLAGTLGVLALPDVPLLLATLLCLDACVRLLRRVDAGAVLELALGLVIGGLTHYRFAAVIAVGLLGLVWLREGRIALRDVRVWCAIGAGALAWLPLLLWNLHNHDAGLRFQLLDRHPWQPSSAGIPLGAMQLLLATPVLLAAMAVAAWRGVRDPVPATRLLAICGALVVLGFLALGFVADHERVSFHWPLPGYVALVPLVPAVLAGWARGWRVMLWATAALGLLLVFAVQVVAAVPAWRERSAPYSFHPSNFAGWDELQAAVRTRLAGMPAGSGVLAGDFKIGAELGHALSDPSIPVLEHPLNAAHGRAPQLALWGLSRSRRGDADPPGLLVAGASHVSLAELLGYYHRLCEQVGPLPAPQVLNMDHGRQRFLLFALPQGRADGPCTTPAMAFVDAPAASAQVKPSFDVAGWAFKDGVGLRAVDVLLDGQVVAHARYGEASPNVAAFWKISTDPRHPHVYFRARVDAAPAGTHWLGLRLHGMDGSVEDWAEQRLQVVP